METLRAFMKSEDAWLAASLLRSRGIEAIVVDENAIGGNLLGIQKNAIRIEVAEADRDEAERILDESNTDSENA